MHLSVRLGPGARLQKGAHSLFPPSSSTSISKNSTTWSKNCLSSKIRYWHVRKFLELILLVITSPKISWNYNYKPHVFPFSILLVLLSFFSYIVFNIFLLFFYLTGFWTSLFLLYLKLSFYKNYITTTVTWVSYSNIFLIFLFPPKKDTNISFS